MATRQRKTPAERAQEAFDVAERLIGKLKAKHAKLYAEIEQIRADLEQAIRRRDYALQNPELPAQNDTSKLADMEAEIDAQNEASKGMDEPATATGGAFTTPPPERAPWEPDLDADATDR